MFKLASNFEIGQYINQLIKENPKFRSNRDFGKACLEEEDLPLSESAINTKSGHISEITRGLTTVQIKDLPVFTKLLDVSCEDILSAGKVRSYNENHITNYKLAASHDEKLWQSYINNEAEFLLNPDEYDKTILDYAFEFKNYEFLKYLVDNEYIWLVEQNPGRRKMIILAIENNDIDMLDEFRAREIPLMYYKLRGTELSVYYDEDLIEAASRAGEKVLDYFSEVITIIVALFHDLCKVNFYGVEKINRKNDTTGQWEKYDAYTYDEQFCFGGHGSKSVYLTQYFIKLTPEEAVAINLLLMVVSNLPSILMTALLAFSVALCFAGRLDWNELAATL